MNWQVDRTLFLWKIDLNLLDDDFNLTKTYLHTTQHRAGYFESNVFVKRINRLGQ